MDSVFAAVFVQGNKEHTVGVAVLKPRLRKNKSDVKTQTLQLYQFVDGERFASLESILVRHAPEHVFISDCGPADNLKIKTLVGDGTAGDSAASDTATNTEIISKAKFDDKEVSPALTKLAGAVDATRADGDEVSELQLFPTIAA